MRAHVLTEQLHGAMVVNGHGGKEVMVLLDGQVLPISGVRWHDGYECFVVEADLT